MAKPGNEIVALDSEDTSLSVAEARHLVRQHMLVHALEALNEIGMNPEAKTSDRVTALKYLVDFAAEAQGTGTKTVAKLSPEAARLIARMANEGRKEEAPRGAIPGDLDTDDSEG